MLRYFNTWKFKHPNANDFIRVMEKESGLELDWFKEYFVYTTKTIDYAVASVEKMNRKETKITLRNNSLMPMPLDVTVTYKDGRQEIFNLPLDLMRGAKANEFGNTPYTVLPDWHWTSPTYDFIVPQNLRRIAKVEIDASQRMIDHDRSNNRWDKDGEMEMEEPDGKDD